MGPGGFCKAAMKCDENEKKIILCFHLGTDHLIWRGLGFSLKYNLILKICKQAPPPPFQKLNMVGPLKIFPRKYMVHFKKKNQFFIQNLTAGKPFSLKLRAPFLFCILSFIDWKFHEESIWTLRSLMGLYYFILII